MWIDRMLKQLCDLELWPRPWIFNVKFLKSHIPGMSGMINMEQGMWVDRKQHPLCNFEFWSHPWPWPWIWKVKFWKSCTSVMGGSIDMEQKGGPSTRCCSYNVTLSHDFDLGISRSNCGIAVSQNWEGWLTWNERYESIGCSTHYVTLTSNITHDLGLWFSRINFQIAIFQEWHYGSWCWSPLAIAWAHIFTS